MLKQEFVLDFDRLCRGLRYEPTTLQVEAWFDCVGRTAPAVWKKAVTALLCNRHFPKLEEVWDAIAQEAEQSRKSSVFRDQIEAARTVAQLHRETQKEEDPSRIPTPATPLFHCIKALEGRSQLARAERHQGWPEAKKRSEMALLLKTEATLTQEAIRLSELIHPDDLRRLLQKYEPQSAAVTS